MTASQKLALWLSIAICIVGMILSCIDSTAVQAQGFPTMSSTSWSATPTLTIFTPTPKPTGTPTVVPTVTPTVLPIITLQPRREYQVFIAVVVR